MKLILIVLALLLVLLVLLLFIYWRDHHEPVQEVTPPQPPRRTYTFNPNIEFIMPRRRPRRRVEHAEISVSSSESEDTFEERNHIVIINGPAELQHLIGLVQQDIMNENVPIFEPAGLRRREREQPVEEFFQDINDHNDDGQNVHNPQIRKSLTDRLLRVIELNGGIHETYEVGGLELPHEQYIQAKFTQADREIRERSRQYHDGLVLRGVINRDEATLRHDKIDMVLKKLSHGYDLVMKDGKSYKENFILVHVWDRINHKDNFAHRDELQISLLDNLIDAVEERQAPVAAIEEFINNVLGTTHEVDGLERTHMTVCINGRVARVLTALVLLDADEKVSMPEKDEKEYMNEAMHKAAQIIENELNTYEVKLPEGSDIRAIYNEPDVDKLSQRERLVLQTFHNHLKETFSAEFHRDYDGVLTPEQVTHIIEQANMGI